MEAEISEESMAGVDRALDLGSSLAVGLWGIVEVIPVASKFFFHVSLRVVWWVLWPSGNP